MIIIYSVIVGIDTMKMIELKITSLIAFLVLLKIIYTYDLNSYNWLFMSHDINKQ